MVEEEKLDWVSGEGEGEGEDSTKKEVRLTLAVSDAPAISPSIFSIASMGVRLS